LTGESDSAKIGAIFSAQNWHHSMIPFFGAACQQKNAQKTKKKWRGLLPAVIG